MLHTLALMLAMVAIMVFSGFVVGGVIGGAVGLGLAFALNFLVYWYSDRIVLKMYGATPTQDYKLVKMAKKLAAEARIPVPRLYMVRGEKDAPNAFATGRSPKNGAICFTRSMLAMEDDEIEAVMAHEMAHIKNRDTLVSMMAATIAGAVSYVAQVGYWSMFMERDDRSALSLVGLLFIIIFAPLAALLVRLAISRNREFGADYTGAVLSKKPQALASALRKIESYSKTNPMQGNASTASLWIVNPMHSNWFTGMFSTHPSTEDRIKRLMEIDVKERI